MWIKLGDRCYNLDNVLHMGPAEGVAMIDQGGAEDFILVEGTEGVALLAWVAAGMPITLQYRPNAMIYSEKAGDTFPLAFDLLAWHERTRGPSDEG